MVELSRLMRKTALDLYTRQCDMEQKLVRAKSLDIDLQQWLETVPSHLHYEHQNSSEQSLKARRLPSYVKKQSTVLRLRE
jgi:hypothetical protein